MACCSICSRHFRQRWKKIGAKQSNRKAPSKRGKSTKPWCYDQINNEWEVIKSAPRCPLVCNSRSGAVLWTLDLELLCSSVVYTGARDKWTWGLNETSKRWSLNGLGTVSAKINSSYAIKDRRVVVAVPRAMNNKPNEVVRLKLASHYVHRWGCQLTYSVPNSVACIPNYITVMSIPFKEISVGTSWNEVLPPFLGKTLSFSHRQPGTNRNSRYKCDWEYDITVTFGGQGRGRRGYFTIHYTFLTTRQSRSKSCPNTYYGWNSYMYLT